MVLKAEQDRVRDLLREAIPMLCKTGLSYKNQFSVEALIGITLDDQCFIVSIKESIESEVPPEENQSSEGESVVDSVTGRKRSRKRKRRRSSKGKGDQSDSESDTECRVKTEKFDDDEGDGESMDAIVIKDEPEDVDIKFETFPAMQGGQPFNPGQSFSQPLPTTGAFNSQSPAFMASPGSSGTIPQGWTPGTPGSQPPGGALGTPDTPGTKYHKKEEHRHYSQWISTFVQDSAKIFMCVLCQKVLKDYYHMLDHVKAHTKCLGDYQCVHCKKTFTIRKSYVRHMRLYCRQKKNSALLK